jgi:hypothetical protein
MGRPTSCCSRLDTVVTGSGSRVGDLLPFLDHLEILLMLFQNKLPSSAIKIGVLK